MYALGMDYWEQVRARRLETLDTFNTIREQKKPLEAVKRRRADYEHEWGSMVSVAAAVASCFMGAFFMWIFIPVAALHLASDIWEYTDGKTTTRKSREGPDSHSEAHAV